jgi:CheY-like chemotaxis protein
MKDNSDTGGCILLVEDYEPNILVTTSFLEELGRRVEVARNGREALEKFPASRYALVFMDLQLPDMDGFEVTKRIRAMEKEQGLSDTPIVAVTGRATEDDRLLCMKAGMNECLSKPFHRDQLEGMLRQFAAP